MPIYWRDHIVSTPDTLSGKPRIKETRIPVSLFLGYLAAGYITDETLNLYQQIPCINVYFRSKISVPLIFIAGS